MAIERHTWKDVTGLVYQSEPKPGSEICQTVNKVSSKIGHGQQHESYLFSQTIDILKNSYYKL